MKKFQSGKLCAIISLALAFTMMVCALPFSAFAETKSESDKVVDMFYKEVVNEYFDDAYALVYKLIVKSGLIDDAIAEIDLLIAQIEDAKAQIPEDVPEEIPDVEDIPEDWEIPENWQELVPEDILEKIPEDLLQDLLDKYGKGTAVPVTPEPVVAAASLDDVDDLGYEEYVAMVNQLKEECDLALDTLNEMKAILTGDELTTYEGLVENVDYLKEMLRDRISRIELLWILLAEDPDNNVDPEQILDAIETLEKVEYELEFTVVPAIEEALSAAAEVAYDPACKFLAFFLEIEVETADQLRAALDTLAGMSEEEIKDRIQEIIFETTHTDYVIDCESYLAAFHNINDRDSYVDLLADELGIDSSNNFVASIEKFADNFADYEAEILKADLITLGFLEIDSLLEIVDKAPVNGTYDIDWQKYLGEKSASTEEKVDAALEDLYEALAEEGVDAEMAEALVSGVEYYIYKCVAHGVSLHEIATKINEINPDAEVLVIGAYNPLSNLTYTYEDKTIEIGEYLGYLFEAFNVYDLAYAIVYDNITFVNTPDVAFELDITEVNEDLITELTYANLRPNEDGYEYIKDQVLAALTVSGNTDHIYGDWTVTDPATCSKEGTKTRVCDVCGHEETASIDIDADAHVWGDWTVTDPSTCSHAGEETRVCTLCNTPETRPLDLDPTVHNWGDWTVTKPANCTEPGEETRTCQDCHTPETRPLPVDPDEHDWQWIIDKPADEEDGIKHEECSRCHAKRNENTPIPAPLLPPTDDSANVTGTVIIAIVALVLAAGVCLFVVKRKHA